MKACCSFLPAAVIFLAFAGVSCKKGNKEPLKPDFLVHGISELTLNEGVGGLPLEIQYVSGPQEEVQLSLSGVPKGVTAALTRESGIPTFSSGINFSSDGSSGGVFPVKLHAANSSVAKDFEFKLHLEKMDCRDIFTGWEMTGRDRCGEEGLIPNVKLRFRSDPERANRLYMDAFHIVTGEFLYSMYMDLNCYEKNLVIPAQQLADGTTVSGGGDYNFIDYTIRDSISNQTRYCAIIFNRN